MAEDEDKTAASWEHKKLKDFKIHGHMKDVIKQTIKASEAELKVLRRKLEKLTYGS